MLDWVTRQCLHTRIYCTWIIKEGRGVIIQLQIFKSCGHFMHASRHVKTVSGLKEGHRVYRGHFSN